MCSRILNYDFQGSLVVSSLSSTQVIPPGTGPVWPGTCSPSTQVAPGFELSTFPQSEQAIHVLIHHIYLSGWWFQPTPLKNDKNDGVSSPVGMIFHSQLILWKVIKKKPWFQSPPTSYSWI